APRGGASGTAHEREREDEGHHGPVRSHARLLSCEGRPSLASGAGLLTSGSSLSRPFPGFSPVVPSGSLPGHSGATVPDSHRLPSSRASPAPTPAGTTGRGRLEGRT